MESLLFKNETYIFFVNFTPYKFPIKYDALTFINVWRLELPSLIEEISSNIIISDSETKSKAYLNIIIAHFKTLRTECNTPIEEIDNICISFNTSVSDFESFKPSSSELTKILEIDFDQYKYKFIDNWEFVEDIQNKFYNYYLGKTIDEIFSLIDSFDLLTPKEETDVKKKTTRIPKTYPNSFTFIMDPFHKNQIPELMSSMNDVLIQRTNITLFKKVFSNQVVNSKLVWLLDVDDFYYFILQLFELKIVKTEYYKWEVAIKCFVDKNGAEFNTGSLKNSNPPKCTSTIDNILSPFKKK